MHIEMVETIVEAEDCGMKINKCRSEVVSSADLKKMQVNLDCVHAEDILHLHRVHIPAGIRPSTAAATLQIRHPPPPWPHHHLHIIFPSSSSLPPTPPTHLVTPRQPSPSSPPPSRHHHHATPPQLPPQRHRHYPAVTTMTQPPLLTPLGCVGFSGSTIGCIWLYKQQKGRLFFGSTTAKGAFGCSCQHHTVHLAVPSTTRVRLVYLGTKKVRLVS
nr:hypothetical protein [Tanacetum cinerariifolium]